MANARSLVAFLVVTATTAACDWGRPDAVIGKAKLADADGTIPAPKGPVVEVPGGEVPTSLRGPVRVAADRNAPFRDVLQVAEKVRAAGGDPVFLVNRRGRVEALPPPAPRGEDSILLFALADGRACISPPDNPERTCVKRRDAKHVDRSFVRQIVRQAVGEYRLERVHVWIEEGVSWANALRAIDGARTCCEDRKVPVSVEPWRPG